MNKKIVWSKRSDDEIWRGGPCDSVRECIEEAEREGYQETDTLALGYAVPYEVNYVNSDMIIEYLQQDAYDEVGDVSDDWLDYIVREQREDLEDRVLKVVKEWLKDCREEPTFYKVEVFDELTLKEALEKYPDKEQNKVKKAKKEMPLELYQVLVSRKGAVSVRAASKQSAIEQVSSMQEADINRLGDLSHWCAEEVVQVEAKGSPDGINTKTCGFIPGTIITVEDLNTLISDHGCPVCCGSITDCEGNQYMVYRMYALSRNFFVKI